MKQLKIVLVILTLGLPLQSYAQILDRPPEKSLTQQRLEKAEAEKAAERRARKQKEAEADKLAEKNRALEEELARMKAADKAKVANEAKSVAPVRTAAPAPVGNIIVVANGQRYEVVGDGSEIKDQKTGLIWQRCSVGQSWDGSTCAGEARTFTFDDAQKQAGSGWRVPTRSELHQIVDYTQSQPAIDSKAFPKTASYYYWTSTKYAGDSSSAWLVGFYYGNVGDGLRSGTFHVRLVR